MKKPKIQNLLNVLIVIGAFVGIILFSTIEASPQASCKFEADFFDVGQGDSALIKWDGTKQILVDGGPDDQALNALKMAMPPLDRRIEYVILTHPHADHLTGLVQVLDYYEVGKIIETETVSNSFIYKSWKKKIEDKKIPVQTITREQTDFLSGAKLEFYWPNGEEIDSNMNNTSIVFKFEKDDGKILFLGDAEKESQSEILKLNQDISSDVVKIAHHGAKESYSEEFILKVKPKIAVISVGKNSFGHPSEIALKSLGALGIKIYKTITDGNVDLCFDTAGFNKI